MVTMKCIGSVLIACLVAGLMAACASIEKDFREASKRDTTDGYTEFLTKHSDSDYDQQVRARLQQLRNAEAAERKAEAAEHKRQASEVEDSRWRGVQAGDIDSLFAFLNDYPEGRHAAEAKAQLQSLLLDIARKDRVTNVDDREGIRVGQSFPADQVSDDEYMQAFGTIQIRAIVRRMKGSEVHQSVLISDNWVNAIEWKKFYAQIVEESKRESDLRVLISVAMGNSSGSARVARFSRQYGSPVQLSFHRGSNRSSTEPFGVVFERWFKDGKVSTEDVKIVGRGLGVVRKEWDFGGSVYEFAKNGAFLLR